MPVKDQKEKGSTLARIIVYTSSFLLIIMTLIIIIRVFMRLSFNITPSWSEEMACLLMVWLTFTGFALGVHENAHLKIDLFYNRFPRTVQTGINIINYWALIIFSAWIMLFHGIKMVWMTRTSRLASIRLPNYFLYLIIPISGLLTIFFLLYKLKNTHRKETHNVTR